MNILIAGAGEVGYHLAKQLSHEEHDITIIDVSSSRLEHVDSVMDVLTITGSSTSLKTLKEAKVNKTDLVIAVTSSEAININTVTLARKLGAKKTVARVEKAEYVTDENQEFFNNLGIDYLIYPEELAAYELVKLIKRAAATDILEFQEGRLSLLGLKLESDLPIIRKTMGKRFSTNMISSVTNQGKVQPKLCIRIPDRSIKITNLLEDSIHPRPSLYG